VPRRPTPGVHVFAMGSYQVVHDSHTWLASGARTTSGSAEAPRRYDDLAVQRAKVTLDITAASGTGRTLTLAIEGSADGQTWTALETFAAQSAVGSVTRELPIPAVPHLQRVRCAWTIGGTTPSFTFSVSAYLEVRLPAGVAHGDLR